jgi:hypothetical protein
MGDCRHTDRLDKRTRFELSALRRRRVARLSDIGLVRTSAGNDAWYREQAGRVSFLGGAGSRMVSPACLVRDSGGPFAAERPASFTPPVASSGQAAEAQARAALLLGGRWERRFGDLDPPPGSGSRFQVRS